MWRTFSIVLSATVLTVGCTPSDTSVTTAVKLKLAADDIVKTSQIDVDTRDHVVTLSGMVDTQAARQQAVTIARQTNGARDVIDSLMVGREVAATTGDARTLVDEAARGSRETWRVDGEELNDPAHDVKTETAPTAGHVEASVTDAALTAALKATFLADRGVPGGRIDIDTNRGIVTLTGRVATRAQANRAVLLSSETAGVKGVLNNLRIDQ